MSLVNTMSSTSNVQNLLTNVFRPVFVYDTTNNVYQSKLELTNIDAVSANIVYTFAAAVGDAMGNVYVGINSGNPNSLLAIKANSNTTCIGKESGSGSTSNTESVFIGYRAGASAVSSSYTVSVGSSARSGGNSNVFIGYATGTNSGSNNIFIGPSVANGTGVTTNNTLLIASAYNGYNPATPTILPLIIGDLSGNRVGINLQSITPYTSDTRLVVNGFTRIGGTTNNGKLGINTTPETFDLDVNGTQRIQDGVGTLTFSNGIQSSSGGYNSSNGTTGVSTTTTVPFKKGMFMLSATSNTTRHGYIGVASSTSAYTLVSEGSNNSSTLITANGSTLVVASGTVGWNITYFPTP